MPSDLTPNTKLSVALNLHPDVLDYIISLSPHEFERLRNPLMYKLMPPRITLGRVAVMTNTPIEQLLDKLHDITGVAVVSHVDEDAPLSADELPLNEADKPEWATQDIVKVVDLLESDERLDADPMPPIHRALHRVKTGNVILVKHKWEPQPLYDIWKRTGVLHYAEQQSDDEWWIYLRKLAPKHVKRN